MNNITDIKIISDELEGTQATFSTWLVAVGDKVEQGQPIAELETDKVAMEVCATVSGVIHSLKAKNGDAVEPEQALGTISKEAISKGAISKEAMATSQNPKIPNSKTLSSDIAAQLDSPKLSSNSLKESAEQNTVNRNSVSPAVRRLLHENNLSLDNLNGSGRGGRVTRDDVIKYIKSGGAKQSDPVAPLAAVEVSKEVTPFTSSIPQARPLQGEMKPHSNMRKSIANHMVSSLLETSPHVTSVFEMDMGNIIEHRKWHKKEYAELGVKLTFTAYFLSAMAKAVATVPQVNAKFHQDALEIFSDINIGVGTALGDEGLVVPVVQQVQSMNLFQIANALNQQTEKARNGKLKSKDLQNGTLTISNHGVSGSLFATPIIINQPQVAILGIGKLEKRVVVEQIDGEDTMVIRPKCYVSLSIDHRALDAHQTNLYLSEFVKIIECWGE